MLGMAPGGFLGVHEVAVDGHLIGATARRDQLQITDLMFELGQQQLRQTDGSRCVTSLCAVFDRYLHTRKLPPSCIASERAALL